MYILAKIIPQPFKESEQVPMGKKDMELLIIVWPIMLIICAIWIINIYRKSRKFTTQTFTLNLTKEQIEILDVLAQASRKTRIEYLEEMLNEAVKSKEIFKNS